MSARGGVLGGLGDGLNSGALWNKTRGTVLEALNIAQLLLYIGGLALIGQGLLFILAGANRETNLFYQLFVVLNRPWVWMARQLSPKAVAERHHTMVAFCVVSVLYILVTLAKIEHCISVQMVGCR